MKVLVVGGGGREHALAWKLAQSPRVKRVFVAPGNGGTDLPNGIRNIDVTGVQPLREWAQREKIGLTVVGPEGPLALGLVDEFREHGLRVFGPTRAAAQLESSKSFSKAFMQRHGIPPERVLGHSDIAPQRKQDPGPYFPWKQLADAGLVQWPDAAQISLRLPVFEASLPPVAWYQSKLSTHGFAVPQTGVWDEATRTVIAAFQMKYRPSNYAGGMDAETASMLDVLTAPAGPVMPEH